MSATSPAPASLAETIAQTALSTGQAMLPMLIAAAPKAAAAASPAAAAAIFAAEVLGSMIKANQAQPSDILTLYAGIGPTVLAQQAVIDSEAAARGVAVDSTPPLA